MTVPSGEHRQGTWDGGDSGDSRAIAVPGSAIVTGTQLVNQERRRHSLAAPTDRTGTQWQPTKRTV